jgi:hypothetical protein
MFDVVLTDRRFAVEFSSGVEHHELKSATNVLCTKPKNISSEIAAHEYPGHDRGPAKQRHRFRSTIRESIEILSNTGVSRIVPFFW